MNYRILFLLVTFVFALSSCNKESSTNAEAIANPGQKLVMESIAAHGGTDAWYNSGLLKFRWTYHMTDRGPDAVVDTVQTVDTKTLAVVHEVVDRDIRFGLNQGEGWIEPADAEFAPPYRFWALTPFYFLGIPFVFNDENAMFELLDETKSFQGKDYQQVKITYNQAAGDSPDDYYVLLIDPETKLTRGCYYIVTSELLGRPKVGPEKFLTLDELKNVNGVLLSSSHKTYSMEDGVIGDQMRYAVVKDIEFVPEGSVDLSVPK